MSKLDDLARAAREATQVRDFDTDPDVVALRIERIRAWCDRLVWTGIVLGLLFTMANVQHFAAGDARPPWERGGSVDWVIAWLLDPMVSLVLIGVLMGEQVINRHGIEAGGWVRITKWVALACTYAMNTWLAWSAGDPAQILLHSVPPVIIVCAVEAVPTLRRQITEAVFAAYRAAVDQAKAVTGQSLSTAIDGPVPSKLVDDPLDDCPSIDDEDAVLMAWLCGEDPVPEPRVRVPGVPPEPSPDQVRGAAEFADEVRRGQVPTIRTIKRRLRIGQPSAQNVRAYLAQIAENRPVLEDAR